MHLNGDASHLEHQIRENVQFISKTPSSLQCNNVAPNKYVIKTRYYYSKLTMSTDKLHPMTILSVIYRQSPLEVADRQLRCVTTQFVSCRSMTGENPQTRRNNMGVEQTDCVLCIYEYSLKVLLRRWVEGLWFIRHACGESVR